jgi:hypothetical protein
MTRTDVLPSAFSILRTNGYRGPYFQILLSRSSPRSHNPFGNRNEEHYNIVEEWIPHYDAVGPYRLEQPRGYENDRNIYKTKYRHPQSNEVLEVYYWFLPFVLEVESRRIPLLEFQYRSWIPHSQRRIEVDMPISMNQFMDIFERIQRDRLEDIRLRDDEPSSRYDYAHRAILSRFNGPDDEDDRLSINDHLVGARARRHVSRPTTPPQPEIRVVQVEVPVERVVVQTRVAPLPKAVGDILIANARRSTDSCPIIATPFSDCDTLSITSCFHVFDGPSLTRWCEDHTSCPVCRAKIENIVTETRGNGVPTM